MAISRRTFLASAAFGAANLILAGCSSAPKNTDGLTATFFKIGKADSILLAAAGTYVLVDTGEAERGLDVVAALDELGVKTIDTLIITHFDQDHVGGAADVLENFGVGQVLVTYRSKESDEIDAYDWAMQEAGLTEQAVTADTTIEAGPMSIQIIAPRQSEYDKDTSNNSSLVCRVTYGSTRLLLSGDIQKERIDEIVGAGYDLTADLIKMPHHGGIEDNTDTLVSAVSPTYAVICCSNKNPEDLEVDEILEDAGVEVFATREGTVTATSDGTKITVDQ